MTRLQCHFCGEYFQAAEHLKAVKMRQYHVQREHRGAERASAVGMQPLEAFK